MARTITNTMIKNADKLTRTIDSYYVTYYAVDFQSTEPMKDIEGNPSAKYNVVKYFETPCPVDTELALELMWELKKNNTLPIHIMPVAIKEVMVSVDEYEWNISEIIQYANRRTNRGTFTLPVFELKKQIKKLEALQEKRQLTSEEQDKLDELYEKLNELIC